MNRMSVLFLVCLTTVAQGATITVTSLADSGPGTLRQSIADAQPGDTIAFATNGVITLANGVLVITNSLTIAGPGPTNLAISGGGNSLIFAMPTNETVTLDSLTIENAYSYTGGAISNASVATLAISNCVFSQDLAGYGAIYNAGALTIYDSAFDTNDSDGAIFNDSSGTATINNSTFTANGSMGEGGAIFNDHVLVLNDCTFANNVGNGYGGAIFNEEGTLIASDCTFSGNYTSSNGDDGIGGAICNFDSGETLSGCTFVGNIAAEGGAINNYTGASTLYNCTLAGNFAQQGSGYYDAGRDPGIAGTGISIFNNCTISGNQGLYASQGGGIYAWTNAVFVLTNTIVAGNTASNAPDIYDRSDTISAVNSLTNGNPLLAPLGNYGGPTQTMPPMAGSPAIDAGDDSVLSFLPTDQRGYARISGTHVDIGAVEVQFAPVENPPQLTGPAFSSAGGGSFQFAFTNAADTDFTVLASTNIALPLADWTPIGDAAQNSPGQYQFSDGDVTNYPERFYSIVSP